MGDKARRSIGGGKAISLVKDALKQLYGVYTTDVDAAKAGNPPRLQKRIEADETWHLAIEGFEGALLPANLVCGKELQIALLTFNGFARNLHEAITSERPEAFMNSTKELADRLNNITNAMRSEIGVGKT
jgi:hypothetical protein